MQPKFTDNDVDGINNRVGLAWQKEDPTTKKTLDLLAELLTQTQGSGMDEIGGSKWKVS